MFSSSLKKRKAEFLSNYFKIKTGNFYFERIEKYFSHHDPSDSFQVISDKTYQDLDLDEVFMFIDRTVSKVGQQCLYSYLRTIPGSKKRFENLEHIINFFKDKTSLREDILFRMSELNENEAYYIASLFQEVHISRPKWFWAVKLLSLLSFSFFFLSFFFSQFIIFLFGMLTINFIFHYWNKNNIYQYTGSVSQLLILNKVAKEIIKLKVFPEQEQELKDCIKNLDSIGKRMSMFKLEAQMQNDPMGISMALDIIKAMFLIEPLLLFNVLGELDKRRKEIEQVYKMVGELDVALSVSSLRNDLAYYSHPVFSDKKKYICGREIYHPLLQNTIANSVELVGKSALLTGSNMSGKTTFIRTIGINAIVSQTLHTSFAKEFIMPPLKIHSAIRITDDLVNGKSYYFEEVLTIKNMLEESRKSGQNLFLLDELFKGTNTTERVAAGKAVLEYLNREGNMVFISTHDPEMAEYLKESYSLYHFTEVVENDTILFDYKIKPGNLKTTNAIRILELNNFPPEVTEEAKLLAKEINKVLQAD